METEHERHIARTAVNKAVANGKLPRISTVACDECGGQAQEYHHGNGYGKAHRLDVTPLCKKCHISASKLTL